MSQHTIPSADVGFSDRVLFTASVTGFCILAVTIYKIIISRVKSSDEIAEDDLSPEELLTRADVSTLNRAQRRARAKAIMKEQRRAAIQPLPRDNDDNNNEGAEADREELLPDVNEENHPIHQPQLSRKERQQAAKAAEREERLLFQEERQRIQKEAQEQARREKKERLAAEAKRLEEEKIRQQLEKEKKEKEERDAWLVFLIAGTNATIPTQSVEKFVEFLKRERTVDISEMSSALDTNIEKILQRLQELIDDGRIGGFFRDGQFVYVSNDELRSIAQDISENGIVTLKDVASICEKVINI
jgi:hypothetical protein